MSARDLDYERTQAERAAKRRRERAAAEKAFVEAWKIGDLFRCDRYGEPVTYWLIVGRWRDGLMAALRLPGGAPPAPGRVDVGSVSSWFSCERLTLITHQDYARVMASEFNASGNSDGRTGGAPRRPERA